MNQPVPPKRVVENKTVYAAVNLANKSDTFNIEASSDLQAKILLLEKLGYRVELRPHGFVKVFVVVDDETNNVAAFLKGSTMDSAMNEVLDGAQWSIGEATFLSGKDTTGLTEFEPD